MWAVRAFEISELGTDGLGRGPESRMVMPRRAETAERERSLGGSHGLLEDDHWLLTPNVRSVEPSSVGGD